MVFRIKRTHPDYAAIRHANFRIPTRGTRAEKDDLDWWTDLQAMALVLPERAVFSHTTAAQIIGLPLPSKDPKPFHVTVPKGRGKRRGIVWHQAKDPDQADLVQGFRVTGPLRTWLDLGSMLDVDHLVAVADQMLRQEQISLGALGQIPPVRGSERLRWAASLANAGSWSPRESLMRMAMYRNGLPKPELNVVIVEDGIVLGTGDFVWRDYRCIVDYDGDHHKEPKQRTQDTKTRNAYAQAGWCHLAITNHMFDEMARTLLTVETMLRAGGFSQACIPRVLPNLTPMAHPGSAAA